MFGKIYAITFFCMGANIFTQALCGVVLLDQQDSALIESQNQQGIEPLFKNGYPEVHAVEKRSPHYYDGDADGYNYGHHRPRGLFPAACKLNNAGECVFNYQCCSGYCHWPNEKWFGVETWCMKRP